MNRTIKFRGVEFFSKKFVYGQTIRETEDGFDIWTGDVWLHCTDLAQLVGYDKDGREVYEGDKILIDDAGEDEFFATCLPVGVNHWGGYFLHSGNFIFTKEFSLKEACQNPWNALQEIDNLIERHVEEVTK